MMNIRQLFRRRVILVITFESRDKLVEVMDRLLAQGFSNRLDMGHAALIEQKADGQPVIENNNVTSREGLISGAMIAAAILTLGVIQLGALRLPDLEALAAISVSILLGCGLGGLIGQCVTSSIGFGFQPDLLNSAARQLAAGEVVLLLQVRHQDVSILEQELVILKAQVQQQAR
jgi:uncharacterized membrane protein